MTIALACMYLDIDVFLRQTYTGLRHNSSELEILTGWETTLDAGGRTYWQTQITLHEIRGVYTDPGKPRQVEKDRGSGVDIEGEGSLLPKGPSNMRLQYLTLGVQCWAGAKPLHSPEKVGLAGHKTGR